MIKFKILNTNHQIIKCKINNIIGNFIIDTGASVSCLDYRKAKNFKMTYVYLDENAVSATDNFKETFISKNNEVKIGDFKLKKFNIVLLEMNHIQKTISKRTNINIDGIIGSDILIKGNAKINFENNSIKLKF